jgi:hypothetical protein
MVTEPLEVTRLLVLCCLHTAGLEVLMMLVLLAAAVSLAGELQTRWRMTLVPARQLCLAIGNPRTI